MKNTFQRKLVYNNKAEISKRNYVWLSVRKWQSETVEVNKLDESVTENEWQMITQNKYLFSFIIVVRNLSENLLISHGLIVPFCRIFRFMINIICLYTESSC